MYYIYNRNFGQLSSEKVDQSQLTDAIDDLVSLRTFLGKNKLNFNTLTANTYLFVDGSFASDRTDRWVTEYIEVTAGDVVTLSYTDNGVIKPFSYNSICLYDSNKNVVSGGDYNKCTFTVPNGVKYVRLTISSYMATESCKPQIELTMDGVPTSYEACENIEFLMLNEDIKVSEKVIRKEMFSAIPKVIHIIVGKEFKMYYKNVMSRYTDRLWLGHTSGISVKRYNDYLSITATEATIGNIKWKIYDDIFNVLDSGTIQVIATADTSKTSKVLVIGDSTVTQSNAISQKLLDCYSGSNGSLTLLGTRGTSPALHEGRAGWTSTMYCTVASNGSVPNPFYNNGFDFSYYMTQQGYNSVDIVVIQLGINDIFSMTYENFNAAATISNLSSMINSILTYNSNIKIIINLISPPNANGTSFTDTYNTTQIDFVYLANTIRLSDALIEYFDDNSSVTISPNNCVLDATTDINDGVHPNASGYAKLGQAIYETINGIYEPSDDGADDNESTDTTSELWNAGSRTAKINTYAPAANTRTISNSYYYYPAAYTGAWADTINISDVSVEGNSLSFKSATSAYGIFVPFLGLDSTKTYRFTVNPTVAGFRVYLVNYDATGVYVNNAIIVDKTTGLKTYDFTPTVNYQQGFCFACLSATANTLGTFTDLSLTEVAE